MTAILVDFPSNQPRPNRKLTEPCQILILPVVRIERVVYMGMDLGDPDGDRTVRW